MEEEKKEVIIKKNGNFFSSFGFKCTVVFILVLILQIPMAFIRSVIKDRSYYHDEAERSILEPKGGEPALQGIVIAIPYDEFLIYKENGKETKRELLHNWLYVTPETFIAQTDVEPEMLRRGIFEVPVFNCDIKASGAFSSVEESSVIKNRETGERVRFEDALLLVGISNKKIMRSLPEIKAGGEVLEQSLSELDLSSPFSNTICYDLGTKAKDGFEFEMLAKIQGGNTLSLTPFAAENKLSVRSNWPTPGFSGGWLPTERKIDENGFSAEWSIPGLSTNFQKRWTSPAHIQANLFKYENVRVSFYQSVDNYQKTTRSAKYSILFLLVPFVALLAFEVFSKKKIHPIQYALIGLANVVFYLLLLSISEHIPFNATYWIASVAVSALMLFYGAAIFHKLVYGVSFAAVNLISYIFLFGTLQAEDYALLIGSIGIFIVVAALMVLTRKIDWYKLNSEQ